ncbi:hypothetical protein S7711_10744 [Stachybotrys chartarum IBT 7711]|uniref:MYND-type domain-containing protein n=1 Tax=Stachybotrys chartarum (strain CBS 109288 / IBT 7711) TaxID=1280523 RepID=A0A084B7H7_STACB|nr:hypothetical protein S7711_10744 [Stachybotrys chartarum IBT 7711]
MAKFIIELVERSGNISTMNAPYPTRATGVSRLPESASNDYEKCANCSKRGCTLRCSRCRVTDIGTLQIFYCSAACQKRHWPSHKEICRPRQQLARAVSIISEIWTAFEQKTYMAPVSISGPVVDGVLDVQGDGGAAIRRRGWTGDSMFRRFPSDVLPAGMNQLMKMAVLYDVGGAEPSTTGLKLLQLLLEPLCYRMRENECRIKDPAIVVRDRSDDANLYGSSVFLTVMTSGGETFVVDLTGSQYGCEEKLYEWNVFRKNRSNGLRGAPTPLGEDRSVDAVYSLLNPTSPCWVARFIRINIITELCAYIEPIIAHTATNVKGFMALPDGEFATARQRLVSKATTFLDRQMQELYQRGIGRVYFDEKLDVCVTKTEEEASKLRNVWLPEEEVERLGDETSLKRAWLRRLANANRNHD